jgi:hypothetical protein
MYNENGDEEIKHYLLRVIYIYIVGETYDCSTYDYSPEK